MMGLFINTVPVRVKADPELGFLQMLKKMQENSVAAKAFEYLTFAEILAACGLKENIIDNLVTFQNFIPGEGVGVNDRPGHDNPQPASPGGSMTPLNLNLDTSQFHQSNYDFNIVITPLNPFRVEFMHNTVVYGQIFLKGIEAHFKQFLNQVIKDKNLLLKELQLPTGFLKAEASVLQDEGEEEWVL